MSSHSSEPKTLTKNEWRAVIGLMTRAPLENVLEGRAVEELIIKVSRHADLLPEPKEVSENDAAKG